jgi:hypothetical protein
MVQWSVLRAGVSIGLSRPTEIDIDNPQNACQMMVLKAVRNAYFCVKIEHHIRISGVATNQQCITQEIMLSNRG